MKSWYVEAIVGEYRSWNGLPSCVVIVGGIKAKSAKQAAFFATKRGHKNVIVHENGKPVYSTVNGWHEVTPSN